MLTACLLAAGAMGLWHTVEFFEKEKVVGEEFYQQWSTVGFFVLFGFVWNCFDLFLVFCRFYVTTQESHTIGHTFLHGLVLVQV